MSCPDLPREFGFWVQKEAEGNPIRLAIRSGITSGPRFSNGWRKALVIDTIQTMKKLFLIYNLKLLDGRMFRRPYLNMMKLPVVKSALFPKYFSILRVRFRLSLRTNSKADKTDHFYAWIKRISKIPIAKNLSFLSFHTVNSRFALHLLGTQQVHQSTEKHTGS